jgi:P2-related tail formation protein
MSAAWRKLAKRAAGFDGVIVLGCDATTETVREALKPADCRIIQGMEMEGVMNILPKVTFPFNVSIEVQGITPMTTNRPAHDVSARAHGENRNPQGA